MLRNIVSPRKRLCNKVILMIRKAIYIIYIYIAVDSEEVKVNHLLSDGYYVASAILNPYKYSV